MVNDRMRIAQQLGDSKRSLTELHNIWSEYEESGPIEFYTKRGRQPETWELVARIHKTPPEAKLARPFRYCIADLRFALNHAVALVATENGIPLKQRKELTFPICSNRSAWQKNAAKLTRLPDGFVNKIEKLQPLTWPTKAAGEHPLVLLNELTVKERHDLPLAIASTTGTWRGQVKFMQLDGAAAPSSPEIHERLIHETLSSTQIRLGTRITEGKTLFRLTLPGSGTAEPVMSDLTIPIQPAAVLGNETHGIFTLLDLLVPHVDSMVAFLLSADNAVAAPHIYPPTVNPWQATDALFQSIAG